jgi:nitrile hydratase
MADKHTHDHPHGIGGFLRKLFGGGSHEHGGDHGHKHEGHGHDHPHPHAETKAHDHHDHGHDDHGHDHHDHGHGSHDHHDHSHGHDHPHPHTTRDFQPDEKIHGYYQLLGLAIKELLIEKKIITPEEIRKAIEARDAVTPAMGARVVARAWVDPAFKARLLRDAHAACREVGVDAGPTNLIAVENTDTVHNVTVCTLCSCYPRTILGLPPSWYKSREYRARIVREPRLVLKEFGTTIPEYMEMRVHDSTADMRYLVVPARPAGTEGMSEDALAALVSRDSMIGVAFADTPAKH